MRKTSAAGNYKAKAWRQKEITLPLPNDLWHTSMLPPGNLSLTLPWLKGAVCGRAPRGFQHESSKTTIKHTHRTCRSSRLSLPWHAQACLLLPPAMPQPRRTTRQLWSKRRLRLLPPRRRRTLARAPQHGKQQQTQQQPQRLPLLQHQRQSLAGRCSFAQTCCWWGGSPACSIAIIACATSATPFASSVRVEGREDARGG